MAQPAAVAPIAAREALWTYTSAGDDEGDQEFFKSLKETVAQEIARRTQTGERVWVGRELRLRIGPYVVLARLSNIVPQLATAITPATRTLAQYHVRGKDEGQEISRFISETMRFPDERMGQIFSSLVGLEAIQRDLFRKLALLLNPLSITSWSRERYGQHEPRALLQALRDRYPLVILEGEVGAGKTALARSVGHPLAERLGIEIALFVVNAQVRGGGHVGEVTQNISRAFEEAERTQEREQIATLLLIDEADALAQARGGHQTHHEDDAGVNTLIQRIDRLRGRPMAVLFATNLAQALDAAILRRAIARYHFDRPDAGQRAELFRRVLASTAIGEPEIAQLVGWTEPRVVPGFGARAHRFTFSDLSQRILPSAVEDAIWAGMPLNLEILRQACERTLPTPELAPAIARQEAPQPRGG